MSSFLELALQYCIDNPSPTYNLDDVCKVLKRPYRISIFSKIAKRVPSEYILEMQKGGVGKNRSQIVLTKNGFIHAVTLFVTCSSVDKGLLYGFVCKYNTSIIKVGRTVNWISRKNNIQGPIRQVNFSL